MTNKTHVFWFTGLSGSGKTTIANAVAKGLKDRGVATVILDGDAVRDKRKVKLGFSRADIKMNNELILKECLTLLEDYQVILVPVITPFAETRSLIADRLGEQVSFIYCAANLESVSTRDVKGLYQKAKLGLIDNMIGYPGGQSYDVPKKANLVLRTGLGEDSLEVCTQQLDRYILKKLDKDKEEISE